MDKFKIDGHKLMYHVPRLNDWLQGKTVYPIYVEVSPSGACNHRCRFCGKDFMGYQAHFLDLDMYKERVAEMGRLGVRSIMLAGEGEPLLHKHLAEMVEHGKKAGIDQAVNTNGVLFTHETAERILPLAEWVRVSLDAATRETHALLHQTTSKDFGIIIANLRRASEIRKAHGWRCTLGVQMILLPENRDEAVPLARMARDIGMDYMVVKPYSQHPLSHTTEYHDVAYSEDLKLQEELQAVNTPDFHAIFRAWAMRKWDEANQKLEVRREKLEEGGQDTEAGGPSRNSSFILHPSSFPHCLALPFWCYIDAEANVWGCSTYLTDPRFLYGNLYKNTFQEIWEGDIRRKSVYWVENEMDARTSPYAECRINCRMDEINRYLWELREPPAHVNFI